MFNCYFKSSKEKKSFYQHKKLEMLNYIKDWRAIQQVNKDTSGLWFFNSSPIAGASQPHRHFQLLRRDLKVRYHALEKSGF